MSDEVVSRRILRGPGSVPGALALMRALDLAVEKMRGHANFFAGLNATRDVGAKMHERASLMEGWADEIRLSHAKHIKEPSP